MDKLRYWLEIELVGFFKYCISKMRDEKWEVHTTSTEEEL